MTLSTPSQLSILQNMLVTYLRLPLAGNVVPGAYLESALAYARNGEKLDTYDYVDVIHRDQKIGWSCKATKSTTPLTWKRAKLPSQNTMITDSHAGPSGLQNLGDSIITFCNDHAEQSMKDYKLEELIYSRLILHTDDIIQYFEKSLCNSENPMIFQPSDFEWRWSKSRSGTKEQLPALHGFYRATGERWWAWHGLGENQLHFTGEKNWWPSKTSDQGILFQKPTVNEKITIEELVRLVSLHKN
jgi:hypothetical protein